MVDIHVSNMIHIPMWNGSLPEHIMEQIRERFCYPNPVYKKTKEAGYSTININPYVQNWNITFLDNQNHLSIPRGQMVWFRDFMNRNGIQYNLVDNRAKGHSFDIEWNPMYSPHDYQEKGCQLIQKYQQGVWSYNPGAGKTVLALKAISELKTTTLIVVNSNELANQWRSRIQKFLLYPNSVGLIQQSTIDIKPITIGILQSLQRWEREELEKLNEYFGILVHDEAHHSPAEGIQQVLHPLSQKYRIALTASKTRKDGLEFLAYDYYDKIRQEETGNVMVPTVYQWKTGTTIPWTRRMRWKTLENLLMKDDQRNNFILSKIQNDIQNRHRVLALFGTKVHAKKMNQMCLQQGIRSVCLIPTQGTSLNLDKVERDVASGEIESITGCKVFDEGIDIPRLSSVHLTNPSSNMELIKQRSGRVSRVFEGKPEPIVNDYADNISPCRASAIKRMEWYVKEFGYKLPQSTMQRMFSHLAERLW